MSDLKPCPFCERIPSVEDCGSNRWFVKCKCGIAQDKLYHQKCDAVKAWNRRKTAQPQTVIDQLRWERDIAVKQLHDLGYEFGEAVKEAQPQRCEDCVNFSKTRLLIPQPEIIRCRDCKHMQEDKIFHQCWCNGNEVKPDHFCGYAERKEKE